MTAAAARRAEVGLHAQAAARLGLPIADTGEVIAGLRKVDDMANWTVATYQPSPYFRGAAAPR